MTSKTWATDFTAITSPAVTVKLLADDGSVNGYVTISSILGAGALEGLGDVSVDGATAGQLLQWNGTKWVNYTLPAQVTTLAADTDVSVGGAVSGNVLTYNGTEWVAENPAAVVSALAGLSDVAIDGKQTTGQVLEWSGAKWVPASAATTLAGLSDVDFVTAAPQTTNYLAFNGTKWVPISISSFVTHGGSSDDTTTTALGATAISLLSALTTIYNGLTTTISNVAALTARSYYDIALFYPGSPAQSAKMARVIVARSFSLAAAFANSVVACASAPHVTFVINILKNGTVIGTATIVAGAFTGSFSSVNNAANSFVPTDILEIDASSQVDATIADISMTLAGIKV